MSVMVLSVIMLIVVMLSSVILSVSVLSAVMQSVIVLSVSNVMVRIDYFVECNYAESLSSVNIHYVEYHYDV
jgi:hypothetical protein